MKKIMALVMTVMMSVGMIGMTAFAAQSPTQETAQDAYATINGQQVDLIVTDSTDMDWKLVVESEEVINLIDQVNNGEITIEQAIEQMFGTTDTTLEDVNGNKVDVAGFKLLTDIFDVRFSDGIRTEDGGFQVSWVQPELKGLSEAAKPLVLHYNTTDAKWELITPDAIDYTTGRITVTVKSLSPVAIIYTGDTTGANTTGTAQTGDSTQPMMLAIIAVISAAVIVGIIVSRRKKTM